MWSETVASCNVDATQILVPVNPASFAIADGAEELLIPSERAEKLGRKLIFRFEIGGECVRIADTWHLKTRLIKFCPQLQMVPRETRVLTKQKLPIIVDIAAARQRRVSLGAKIRA